ncbi:MAG: hypothetical protein IPP87_25150 [Ideonella sp.]|nr:hypothetical protein [Ideonella sp.]
MSTKTPCPTVTHRSLWAVLLFLALFATSQTLAQPAAPRSLRPDLSQTERDLAAMQSEIDFWERITLDRDVLVLPVQTNMGSIAIPARRAEVVAYLSREIATDLLTGSRRNFRPWTERILELQQLSNANKDAIRSELLRDLYSSRYTLLEQRNMLTAGIPTPPLPPPSATPMPHPTPPRNATREFGDGWVLDRMIIDPNLQGPGGQRVLGRPDVNAAGGSVNMSWQPRRDCTERWNFTWQFDSPLDFVRQGMRIPVRMNIKLVGPGCNYPLGSYISLGQQNWEPYLSQQIPVARIAPGAFEQTAERIATDSTRQPADSAGSATIIVRHQPPEVGQSWAIFRIFCYVPGFNYTVIYVFRGN